MRSKVLAIVVIVGLVLAAGPVLAASAKVQKQREGVRKMVRETLAELYKIQPSSKAAIAKAAGYAVFSNVGIKILVLGSGKGGGLAVNNATKKETFMKMLEVQAGLGFGIKKFRAIFVFQTGAAYRNFITSGWTFGAQASASAKSKTEGAGLTGAVAVAEGVWVYQLTGSGLALEATVKGSKFYRDDDLN